MEIFDIEEPSIAPKKAQKVAVGIDFGTTNSLIAYSEDYQTNLLDFIPTICDLDGRVGLGNIRSIKRLIGKSYKEIMGSEEISDDIKSILSEKDGEILLKIGNKNLRLYEVISLFIDHLKQIASSSLEKDIEAAVITVPAHFDDMMRNCIKQAAAESGLEVLRLISEPTAAAYAYGLENAAEGKYAIYDLGGGTFDISLLRMQMGVFQVIATDGDNNLGGDDIDFALSKYFSNKYGKHISSEVAKEAKEHLTKNDSWQKDGIDLSLDEFEEVILPILKPTKEMVQNLIKDHDISGIILVGGATRIRLVKNLLLELSEQIYDEFDPDKVVAFGAALQSENLTSGSRDLIIDVVPLSLGIEIMGGIMEKIILRNSPLPISMVQEYTTYADNQTEIQINIFQGEREMVKDCRSLGRFALSNIPLMKAGTARIEVTFSLDVDGLLTVSALEKVTNTAQKIEVRPIYGIGNQDIENMVEDSYKNARSDHEARLLAESIIAANREIDNLQKAFIESPDIISVSEKSEIEEYIVRLEKSIELGDRDSITSATKDLNDKSEHFREERMNHILQESLKGKKV